MFFHNLRAIVLVTALFGVVALVGGQGISNPCTTTTSSTVAGCVRPDGTTITNTAGAISVASPATAVGTSVVGQIQATATNDNAAAGKVGEYIRNVVASGSAVDLGGPSNPANIASISLTAGDWDVWGHIIYVGNSATVVVYAESAINTSLARNFAYANTFFNNSELYFSNINGAGFGCIAPMQRVSISSTTTVYLVGYANYSVNSLSAYGFIAARRVR